MASSALKAAIAASEKDSRGTTLVVADLQLGDDAVPLIAKKLPRLTVLQLTHCALSPQCFKDISQLANLERIFLSLCGVVRSDGELDSAAAKGADRKSHKRAKSVDRKDQLRVASDPGSERKRGSSRRLDAAGSTSSSPRSRRLLSSASTMNLKALESVPGVDTLWSNFPDLVAHIHGRPMDTRHPVIAEGLQLWAEKLPKLADVTFEGSKITEVHPALFQSSSLQRLCLSHARLHGTTEWFPSVVKSASSAGDAEPGDDPTAGEDSASDSGASDVEESGNEPVDGGKMAVSESADQPVFAPKSLRELNLSFNYIKYAPESLGALRHLRILDLSHNSLKKFPFKAICRLKNLAVLDMSENELTDVSKYVGRLEKLVSLNVRNNKLTSLRAELCALPKLKTLTVSGNKIQVVPSISTLAAIQTLVMANNHIKELPDDMFARPGSESSRLTKLVLDDNHLKALPETFSSLVSLQEFSCVGNGLESLPDAFEQLKKLRVLMLGNNVIEQLPPSLAKCTTISTLSVENNAISDPESILALRNNRRIARLNVVGNPLPATAREFIDEHGAVAWVRQSASTLRTLKAGGSPAINEIKTRPGRTPSLFLPESPSKNEKDTSRRKGGKRTLRSIFRGNSARDNNMLDKPQARGATPVSPRTESVVAVRPSNLTDEELTAQLMVALDDMEMPDAQRKAILLLPTSAQWSLLCQYQQKTSTGDSEKASTPGHYSDMLQTDADSVASDLALVVKQVKKGKVKKLSVSDPDKLKVTHSVLMGLRLTLEAATKKWTSEFIGADGSGLRSLVQLVSFLALRQYSPLSVPSGGKKKQSPVATADIRKIDDMLFEGLRLLRALAKIRMPLLVSLTDVPVHPTFLLACTLYTPMLRTKIEALSVFLRFASITSVSDSGLVPSALQFAADLNKVGKPGARYLVLTDMLLLGSPENIALSLRKQKEPDAPELFAIGTGCRAAVGMEEQVIINPLKLLLVKFVNEFLNGIEDLSLRYETRGELLSLGLWQRMRELLGDETAAADSVDQCHHPLSPIDEDVLDDFAVEAETFKQSMNEDQEDVGDLGDELISRPGTAQLSSTSSGQSFGYAYAPRLAATMSSSSFRSTSPRSSIAGTNTLLLLNATYEESTIASSMFMYEGKASARVIFDAAVLDFGLSSPPGVALEELFGLYVAPTAVSEARARASLDTVVDEDEDENENEIDEIDESEKSRSSDFVGWVDLEVTCSSLNLPADTRVEVKARPWQATITCEVPSSVLKGAEEGPFERAVTLSPDMTGDSAASAVYSEFRDVLSELIDPDSFGLLLRSVGGNDGVGSANDDENDGTDDDEEEEDEEEDIWLGDRETLQELRAHILTRTTPLSSEFVFQLKPLTLRVSFLGSTHTASDVNPMHSPADLLEALTASGVISVPGERVSEYALSVDNSAILGNPMSDVEDSDILALSELGERTFLRDQPLVKAHIPDGVTLFIRLRPRKFELRVSPKGDAESPVMFQLQADATYTVAEVSEVILAHPGVSAIPGFSKDELADAARQVMLCVGEEATPLGKTLNVREISDGQILTLKSVRTVVGRGDSAVGTVWQKRRASGALSRSGFLAGGARSSDTIELPKKVPPPLPPRKRGDPVEPPPEEPPPEEPTRHEEEEAEQFIPDGEPDAGRLSAASLSQVVMYLTNSAVIADGAGKEETARALVSAYSNFTTSLELLVRLLDRYAVPSEMEEDFARSIRGRVAFILSLWKETAQQKRLHPVWHEAGPEVSREIRKQWTLLEKDQEHVAVLDVVASIEFKGSSESDISIVPSWLKDTLVPLLNSLEFDIPRDEGGSLLSELRGIIERETGESAAAPELTVDDSDGASGAGKLRDTKRNSSLFKRNSSVTTGLPGEDSDSEEEPMSTDDSGEASFFERGTVLLNATNLARSFFGGAGHSDMQTMDLASFFDLYSKEVAVAFTLRAHELYKEIRLSEFYKLSWEKPKLQSNAVHLVALSNVFNDLASKVATVICSEPKSRKRAQLISAIIKLAGFFYKFRNFLCLTAVVSGLNNSAIQRMKWTFKKVPRRSMKELEDLEAVMSMERSFKAYRTLLDGYRETTACIPYLGVHLGDMVFVEENPDSVGDSGQLWNISKLRLLYRVQKDVVRYCDATYHLSDSDEATAAALRLHSVAAMNEKDLYALSLKAEPRGARRGDIL